MSRSSPNDLVHFVSFSDFINCHKSELEGKKVAIVCDDFDEGHFPNDYLTFDKIKIESLEVECNGFGVGHLSFLCRYLDDELKPKITIKTNTLFFPDDSSFVMAANIDKKMVLNLETQDRHNIVARMDKFHQYFSNTDSSHHRDDVEILVNNERVKYLRHLPAQSYNQNSAAI
jgi:hypothetical protein